MRCRHHEPEVTCADCSPPEPVETKAPLSKQEGLQRVREIRRRLAEPAQRSSAGAALPGTTDHGKEPPCPSNEP